VRSSPDSIKLIGDVLAAEEIMEVETHPPRQVRLI
jgi:hypothetical protein